MLEEINPLSEVPPEENADLQSLSLSQVEYINECVNERNLTGIVDRIDEFSTTVPPKALDANPKIAEYIKPLKGLIPTKYLEAPGDFEQVRQISEYLVGIDELKYENWQKLTPEERLTVLQDAESAIAKIEHRTYCPIRVVELPEGHFGSYSPVSKNITLNALYLRDNSLESYRETLDTLIHEGRHAYQDYNMTQRCVHPSGGDVTNWVWNEYELHYQTPEECGFKAYKMQPVESDARAFAEDVLNAYIKKIA